MKFWMIALTGCLLAVASCSSGVKRGPTEADAGRYVLSAQNPVGSLAVTLTPEAKQKAAKNLKFSSKELQDHLERGLSALSLIDSARADSLPRLEVQVTDIRVRSNFSAVAFGFMAGADSLDGDMIVSGQDGRQLDRFSVSTSYALGGLAGGQDDARMGWLYEKFSEEALNELQGITKPAKSK